MDSLPLQLAFVFALLLANGVFAMAEIALVSSRRARLQQLAEAGHPGAARALALARAPNRFLSTVQVGITLVGVLAGAFGGATLAAQLAPVIARVPALAPWSDTMAFVSVVSAITFLSLVIGELVPKRLGLSNPERIASALAKPMEALARAAGPAVHLLERSTNAVLKLFRVGEPVESPVTEEEIALLIRQGTQTGIFVKEEERLLQQALSLAEVRAVSIMTPRPKIVWIDLHATPETVRALIREKRHSRYPVGDGSLDRCVGVVDMRDLWDALDPQASTPVERLLRRPLMVPETTSALNLLEQFRVSGVHLALVLDEYGAIEGVVTVHDVLEVIVGNLPAQGDTEHDAVVRRADGSWLVDATVSIEDCRARLELPDEIFSRDRGYHTVGGFVATTLGRIPRTGEAVTSHGVRVEVVDMDGHRVDKVLVSMTGENSQGAGEAAARSDADTRD
jgi:putative hemolysin